MRGFAILVFLAFPFAAIGQEQTVVSPFADSTFVGQYVAEFDQVTILVRDGNGHTQRSEEGQVRASIYAAPEGKSQLEIIRNFEMALEAGGFEYLFNEAVLRDRFDTPEGAALRDWVEDLKPLNTPREYPGGTGSWRLPLDNIYAFPDYYIAAERTASGVETVFALTYNSQRNVYLLEEVSRAAMEEGGVTISEAQLSSGIEAEGRAVLYGVQFDVGSSVLRPSSVPSIEVIANVLRNRPGRFYVVGHTSDTGSFELNMQLSADRAQAIIDALGRDYGIDTTRLQAAGVGPVAPLASNQNDAGRQLNRRVELVERLE